jgi:hypothetical protein
LLKNLIVVHSWYFENMLIIDIVRVFMNFLFFFGFSYNLNTLSLLLYYLLNHNLFFRRSILIIICIFWNIIHFISVFLVMFYPLLFSLLINKFFIREVYNTICFTMINLTINKYKKWAIITCTVKVSTSLLIRSKNEHQLMKISSTCKTYLEKPYHRGFMHKKPIKCYHNTCMIHLSIR